MTELVQAHQQIRLQNSDREWRFRGHNPAQRLDGMIEAALHRNDRAFLRRPNDQMHAKGEQPYFGRGLSPHHAHPLFETRALNDGKPGVDGPEIIPHVAFGSHPVAHNLCKTPEHERMRVFSRLQRCEERWAYHRAGEAKRGPSEWAYGVGGLDTDAAQSLVTRLIWYF